MSILLEIIPNKENNQYCGLAVLLSLHTYFFNQSKTFEDFEKIMKPEPNKDTWGFPGHLYFAKKGVKIKTIEEFDYEKYVASGIKYIEEKFSKQTADWLINESNLKQVESIIPEYIRYVEREVRKGTIDDVDIMLQEDYIVMLSLNSFALDRKEGFRSHAVIVVSKYPDDDYEVNDPGLPPQKRKVDRETLAKALADVGEVTGFKKE